MRKYLLALIPLVVCLAVAFSFRLVEPEVSESRAVRNEHRKSRNLSHYESIWIVSGVAFSGLTVFLLGVYDVSRKLKERQRRQMLAERAASSAPPEP